MQERVDLREGWGLSVPSRWLRLCCRAGCYQGQSPGRMSGLGEAGSIPD